jgi:hypothetical protein
MSRQTGRRPIGAKFGLTGLVREATIRLGQPRCRLREEITMDEPDRWRHMSSAPRDGSRILVTVRPSEQGPAEVDLAYWSRADQFGSEGWRASDSSPGRVVEYAEPELKCWMPLPTANLSKGSLPSPWDEEDVPLLDGSGI